MLIINVVHVQGQGNFEQVGRRCHLLWTDVTLQQHVILGPETLIHNLLDHTENPVNTLPGKNSKDIKYVIKKVEASYNHMSKKTAINGLINRPLFCLKQNGMYVHNAIFK